MRDVIVGTAGHVDHGKTSLIKALTGIDTDRLDEEKRRGISIDLGFAHLQLPGVRIGFIDVPGHERFVKNMLAGIGGIDFVLLVIAADESIKPQTREHLAICQLLGIQRGLVALTKTDMVDEDVSQLVQWEVEDFLRGTFLDHAPIVAVSAQTGAGLDQLRHVLEKIALSCPPRAEEGWFRLPIDRTFSLRGFGTVVTGTLLAGSLRVEDEVEAQPGGRRYRVRGLQVYGEPVQEARAGQRTAVNLSGATPDELARGTTLTVPGKFHPTRELLVRLELTSSISWQREHTLVHFHAGSAETVASLRRPREGYARLRLEKPLLILPGDRFIIRRFSPVTTIGGGTVLEIDPPRRVSMERAKMFEQAPLGEQIRWLAAESSAGFPLASLVGKLGLPERALEGAVPDDLVLLPGPSAWLISRHTISQAAARLIERLREFHSRYPLLEGAPVEQMRSETVPGAPASVFEAVLTACGNAVVQSRNVLRLASHVPAGAPEEVQMLEEAFRRSGLAGANPQAVLGASGLDVAKARVLYHRLLREGRLVRIAEDLTLHSSVVSQLVHMLQQRRGQRFTVSQFKEWTQVSRKHAIPLLEWLDRERITRREGDQRLVL